jgi:hypothetical protein
MGSTLNDGDQLIGWKYYTPLKGDYLNTILGETITPGLVTRPRFMMSNPTAQYARFQVAPFSCLVIPEDDDGIVGAPNNASNNNTIKNYSSRLVKVTLSQTTTMQQLTPDAVAIGVSFALTDGQQASRNWYASIDIVTKPGGSNPINSYKGIIIGTVQYNEKEISAGVFKYGWSITTSGADISNVLLQREGWNPERWISLISPRRVNWSDSDSGYNQLEVRTFNNSFNDYISGAKGIKLFNDSNTRYNMPKTAADGKDPNGIRGYMDKNISFFSLNTKTGLSISNTLNTLMDSEFAGDGGMKGGVFAYVDATTNNDTKSEPDPGDDTPGSPTYNPTLLAFSNKMIIKPVKSEGQHFAYFKNDGTTVEARQTNTLYIR